jgi:PCAF (P300/CBP-associated factor) N-terminal domain
MSTVFAEYCKLEFFLVTTSGRFGESTVITIVFSESHVSHLQNVSEDEINRLLGMVVDVENLFTCVHKEEDVDTKQVYFYLFKVCESTC